MGYEKIMSTRIGEGGLRRSASLAKQSRSQKVWFAIKSNTLEMENTSDDEKMSM